MRLLTNLAYLRTLGKQVGGMKTTRNVLRKNLDFVELDLKIVQEWLTNNPNPLTSLHTPKKPTFLKSQNAADAAATIMKKKIATVRTLLKRRKSRTGTLRNDEKERCTSSGTIESFKNRWRKKVETPTPPQTGGDRPPDRRVFFCEVSWNDNNKKVASFFSYSIRCFLFNYLWRSRQVIERWE